MTLDNHIEAILFFKGEPVSIKQLSGYLDVGEEEVAKGVHILQRKLHGRGVTLLEHDGEVALVSVPEASELIRAITKAELVRDLGKAGLDTLAIILYEGPVSRAEIDMVRGVNSQYILRNLLVRGLVERMPDPDRRKGVLYRPTADLLAHLGVRSIAELPDYDVVKTHVEAFRAGNDNHNE